MTNSPRLSAGHDTVELERLMANVSAAQTVLRLHRVLLADYLLDLRQGQAYKSACELSQPVQSQGLPPASESDSDYLSAGLHTIHYATHE